MINLTKNILYSLAIILLNIYPCSFSPAQTSKIDSLKQVITTAKHDTTKIKALNALAWQLMYSNPDTSIIISTQALATAKKINYEAVLDRAATTSDGLTTSKAAMTPPSPFTTMPLTSGNNWKNPEFPNP